MDVFLTFWPQDDRPMATERDTNSLNNMETPEQGEHQNWAQLPAPTTAEESKTAGFWREPRPSEPIGHSLAHSIQFYITSQYNYIKL